MGVIETPSEYIARLATVTTSELQVPKETDNQIWERWKTEAKKSKSLFEFDEEDRKKGRSSYYNPNLETWSIQPTWDYDDEFDYSNVAYWRYRAGNCPHDYHTPGWIPTPWPKSKSRSYPNTIWGGLSSLAPPLSSSKGMKIDASAIAFISFVLFLMVVYGG